MMPTLRIMGKPVAAVHIEERMVVNWFGSRRSGTGLTAYIRIPIYFRLNRLDLLGPFKVTFYMLGKDEFVIHCKLVR